MLRIHPLIRRVHISLSSNSHLHGEIANALESSGIEAVSNPHDADCLVTSGAGGEVPIDHQASLVQLVDCGALDTSEMPEGTVVANASPVLAKHAAKWCLDRLHDAIPTMRKSDNGGVQAGIIGLGTLGSEIAESIQGDVERTWIADVRTPRQQLMARLGVRRSTLDLVLSKADVVFVSAHHGPTADPLLSARELRLMPKNSALINPSGTRLVDQHELENRLDSGLIAYAAQREETAHEFDAENNTEEVASFVVENIKRMNKGEPVRGVVEPVDFPSAGDPAFWSSRMSPSQTAR